MSFHAAYVDFFDRFFPTETTTTGGGVDVGFRDDVLLDEGQQQLFDDLIAQVSGTPFGVDVAGPSNLQQFAFDRLPGQFGNRDSAQAGSAINDLLQSFDPESTTNFFNQSIREPALRTFQQDIIPQIQESFGAINAGSSSGLNRALSKAGGNLASDLSGQLSSLLFNTEQATAQRRLNTLPQAASFQQAPFDMLTDILGAGDIQRGIEQEQLTGQYINPLERLLPLLFGTQSRLPVVQERPFTTSTEGIF